MTITSKYTSRCKACDAQINPGDQINWVKGTKGVTCASCPAQSASANGAPAPPANALQAALQAALNDGRGLRARVGEQDAMIAECHATMGALIAQRDELQAINAARAVEIARLGTLAHDARAERDELRARLTAAPSALVEAANHALALDADDDCPL